MKDCFVSFKTRIKHIELPLQLNNPFGNEIPEIAQIAVNELQDYISANEVDWVHDFGFGTSIQQGVKGKMFGVLVVQNVKGELGYLSTFSGKLLDDTANNYFVPSVFDATVDDNFIQKGMLALTAMSREIKDLEAAESSAETVAELKRNRKNKSYQLQEQLFANYHFTNRTGITQNLLTIFANTPNTRPAAGTGECAAPKLLEYAMQNSLKPIAITEFWWGRSPKAVKREHKANYPACQNKCRHLLEYMLDDFTLFDHANS
ncbi:MAG: tRNA pseudouridine32 synthase/23S rRNA pseudouridine746 synthase [Crocinitomix sp.]|jgi:tRNA pseudouridine32 synthase/23S rRNA pseudouridine746 synthase